MRPTRRQALRVLGGGAVLAAGTIGTFLATRSPTEALAPWRVAGDGYRDPRLHALSWAVLAPNPHNRQPWLVRLDNETDVTLFADPERKLPETDPYDRQITIGLGCFLEIARQAASTRGYAMTVVPFPQGDPWPILDRRPVARLRFAKADIPGDPLFAEVPNRRSCKEPYDMNRPVTAVQAEALGKVVDGKTTFGTTVDPTRVARLSDLAWKAFQVEAGTPRTYKESVDLMRLGKAEIEANPDGIDLGGPFLESLQTLGLMTRAALLDPTSKAYQQGLEMYRTLFEATPAYVWLKTPDNSRAAQLSAGAAWVRVNLAATAAGIAIHPVSQFLQEYPEMAPLRRAAQDELAEPDETVQMLGRLGYGPAVAPSPRWKLETRLMTG